MKSDQEIAQKALIRPIKEIAEKAGLQQDVQLYGEYKAKVPTGKLRKLEEEAKPEGKLILVTAMTPTKFGEGKTTNTIGLGQALQKIGKKSMAAIREPSLGPCMGIKGGAAGGGYSQVLPMDEINLHFTGDMHAVSITHNLLSALIDNHIHRQKEPVLNPRKIQWKRVMDMNDRSLREIIIGAGKGGKNGVMREDGFEITAASEVMAVLALADSITDLKERLGRIIIGETWDKKPVTAADINAHGAMAALLKQALDPNLVQSIEGMPVFVHAGPFANIAHGCSSLTATKMALKMSDYTVTEAGFGSDLGAEKFYDITCRAGGLKPSAAVLVVTLRAFKVHGLDNILKHAENMGLFNVPVVVSINRFADDDPKELEELKKRLEDQGTAAEITDFRESGGAGGTKLAERIVEICERDKEDEFTYLYPLDMGIREKIETIAEKVYGAGKVSYNKGMITRIRRFEEQGYGKLPICIAKTQMSLSDDAKVTGRPKDFTITVKDARISAGAGFIVVYTGDIMTMPGLPMRPSAEEIDIDAEGNITGLF
ncbi:MAG: formate--tetrahydrofolate ligase [Spirochaetia bacterium]|nr:formate--tetrahydrofolate ligase [Spirochaetia bacterium]MCF7952542.1 formate--tetrahydrofolate ligase [Spirochaetales bacterium]